MMQKEELLHLHMLLVHIRKFTEMITGTEIPAENYDAMNISPVHIHKNKVMHKRAILTLTSEIVTHLRNQRNAMISYASETSCKEVAAEH